jgi:predicted amidohydrolase YtcJ
VAWRFSSPSLARVSGGSCGTIEPGKLADLVVLSSDYMAVPEDQIKDIKADLTLVGGKVVFQR